MKTNYLYLIFIFLVPTLFPNFCNSQSCIEVGGLNGLAANEVIFSLCSSQNGKVYAAGGFKNANNHSYVAVWDGVSWSDMGGPQNTISRICSDAQNNIYAIGYSPTSCVSKWDSQLNIWTPMGTNASLGNCPYSICSDNIGNLFVGGQFLDSAGGYFCVARFNPFTNDWEDLGNSGILSTLGNAWTLCSDLDNNIYAAGSLINANGKQYVAKWDYQSGLWSELGGANNSTFSGDINSIVADKDRNIYAAGMFGNSFGRYVAKLDYQSNTWSELGGTNSLDVNNFFTSLCTDSVGNIYAAGAFDFWGQHYVAKWDKSTNIWSNLDTASCSAPGYTVESICSDINGNVYMGGYLLNSSSNYFVGEYVLSTGISSINSKNTELEIYPNPTSNNLKVKLKDSGNYSFQIFNSQNKLIFSYRKQNCSTLEMPTSNLAAGVYFLEVIADNISIYHKTFVKTNCE